MSEKKSIGLQSLTEHYSLEEITSIFSNIDAQVVELHKSAESDFSMFKDQFKKFNTTSEELENNLADISNILSEYKLYDVLKDFNTFYDSLKHHFFNSRNHFRDILSLIEKIQSNAENIAVPVKNFKQNLMTLKFLVANVKVNFRDTFSEEDELQNTIEEIENLIEKIRKNLPSFARVFNSVKHTLESDFIYRVQDSQEKIDYAEKELNDIFSHIKKLVDENQKLDEPVTQFKERLRESNVRINKIITDIQYDDIIRQKMEHIQATHDELIKELNSIQTDEEQQQIVLFQQAKYASQIPYISELQISQLIHTNREYQEAVESIIKTFNELHKDLSFISEKSQSLSRENIAFIKEENEYLKKQLNQSVQTFTQIQKNYDFVDNTSKSFSENIHDLLQHFDTMQKLDEQLESLSADFSDKLYNSGDEKSSNIALQMKNVVADISKNIKNCDIYLNHNKQLNDSLQKIVNEAKGLNNNAVSQQFSDYTYKIIDQVSTENEKIRNYIDKNAELSKSREKELVNALKNIQYYDFYETKIESIILELNEIHKNLQNAESEFDNLSKKERLEKIKHSYTTKSERDVHNKIINEDENSKADESETDESETDGEEDDIEFF